MFGISGVRHVRLLSGKTLSHLTLKLPSPATAEKRFLDDNRNEHNNEENENHRNDFEQNVHRMPFREFSCLA